MNEYIQKLIDFDLQTKNKINDAVAKETVMKQKLVDDQVALSEQLKNVAQLEINLAIKANEKAILEHASSLNTSLVRVENKIMDYYDEHKKPWLDQLFEDCRR